MKRLIDIFILTITGTLILALGIAFFLLPDRQISDKENRTLAQAPALRASSVLSGEYTEKLGEYFADQFPGRDAFISIKAYSELAFLKRENNGVIYGKESTLIPKTPDYDFSRLERNLSSAAVFSDTCGIPVLLAPLPRTADVFAERLPSYYPAHQDDALWDSLYAAAKERGVPCVSLHDPLCESNRYYRTDHHYTTDGAYLVYCLLAGDLGYEAYEESFFERETVSENFCGTAMRTSGFYLVPTDSIVLYRYEGDDAYTVKTSDGEDMRGFYDFDALNGTDQYAIFLGGNHARVDVSADGAGRQKLLVIRDSYADCLTPFLALHYDLTLIDLRYYTENIQKLVFQEGFDRILVLESVTELMEGPGLSYLEIPYSQEQP